LNKEQIMNFSMVDPPRTDGEQKNPKPLLNFLVLIFVGATAGLASALVVDKFTALDNTDYELIVSARAIEDRWDLPVLASIPVIEAPKTTRIFNVSSRSLLPSATEETGKTNLS
jgi:capsular polysaccharide biosynthesis protein